MEWTNLSQNEINEMIANYDSRLNILDDIYTNKSKLKYVPPSYYHFILSELGELVWLEMKDIEELYNANSIFKTDVTFINKFCTLIADNLTHGSTFNCSREFYTNFIVKYFDRILLNRNIVYYVLQYKPNKEEFKEIIVLMELYMNSECSIPKEKLISEITSYAKQFNLDNTFEFLVKIKGA